MRRIGAFGAVLIAAAGSLLLPVLVPGLAVPSKNAGAGDLIAAVKVKDGARVSQLLHLGADPSGRDSGGMTPLHYASSGGDLAAAVLLMAAGADVNARDSLGRTPLHAAASAGQMEVAKLLVAGGADARAVSSGGLTPSDEASRNHQQALADFLRSRESTPAPSKGSGKSRVYTNDDLAEVRRRNRLANEDQLAKAGLSSAAGHAPAPRDLETPPTASDDSRKTLTREMKDHLKKAFDEGDWIDDIEAAQQYSKETRRPVLALFTGSDWCHFCKQLEANVLTTDTFRQRVRGKYILLYVDFPRQKSVPKAVLAERTRLAQKYGVRAYPTLVVLDKGDHYLDRISGFRAEMTAEKYISQIEAIAP